ncbi:MAG: ATP-binding protein, partial [Nostoc sp. EkiNYC01]|nr:ATP-binding protein [Nostoc sp. EkiNYC01]
MIVERAFCHVQQFDDGLDTHTTKVSISSRKHTKIKIKVKYCRTSKTRMSPNSHNSYIRNPYIVGRPVQMPDEFFGRAMLLRTIADSLQQNAQFILLHGQRRIGKSSVLRNIPLFVSQDEFVFVPCDLEE